ncbi:protein phosphatase 1 regulatory inhibitor subunit 16B-like [Paramacrobiotus metropolitanus]|uniref:protein phosphatase 1 regulatory inhibitor subunit 16B-like n=1 Tax=Paramacrobiotus metropolitanus TaxID=2943436 RepID=UPI00244628F9|nr:protein phosphatase 1 regulatory inhibitor subunit 16B-like [Paramacrobiotus metropolitanus]XP_055328047.1 protein phosphatase 1 regulatory inhibitor subunit 16B-like [Paramacrobiotus metropolitanus]XP_055328048.1 protein phosphatase 1 regulatory inhibitor subunit 16B-like [Paramacrobiotus metropolitanus]XP_055328049.1 protein phosphatase 1 regulatory inhibitor subunit 16B-like [Paramacrobiotus metropolitanus]XP_055328050.1 protein phosphatase 1 regulatory inhibitor subunit 16B-like [Paramac
MTYKFSKHTEGDPYAHLQMDGAGLYRLAEEDEGISPDVITLNKEYISHIQQDGDLGDDMVLEYKTYQDQSFFERSQKAKRVRQQQLESWNRREMQGSEVLEDGLAQSGSLRHRKVKKKKKTVMFEWNVLLMDAVLRNELMEVRRLLTTYEDLERCPRAELANCRSPDGLTPLHQCCIENLEDMARLLIDNGANIRAVDSELWTPLHAASTCGHLPMVRILLDAAKAHKDSSIAGSNDASNSGDLVRDILLAVNSDGNMPYDLCDNDLTLAYIEQEMQKRGITQDDIESKRHKKEVDMLRDLQSFIDANFTSRSQPSSAGSLRQQRNSSSSLVKVNRREIWDIFTAASKTSNALLMHVAVANGYLEVMDLLLKYDYPLDLEDDDGWVPIHAAVAWNQPLAAKRLVEAGADITAKVRGTNETAVDLANVADTSEEVDKVERFRDNLILWDAAYKAKCEEEAKLKLKSKIARNPSSESITSAPSSTSPLMRRSSPKRVQRRSSLKDKEDLIALLQTLGDHDLKSAEDRQTTIYQFSRSPAGSLRDRNPVLPNVPEEAVTASAIVHIEGLQSDVDLINQTISPELISSLLRTFEEENNEDAESVAEQLMKSAEESLNQIDQPVTLSQLKSRRNRFRLLKRKEKPLTREFPTGVAGREDSTASCLPVNGTANGGQDSVIAKFKAPTHELPVGAEGKIASKMNDTFAVPKKKEKTLYKVLRPGKEKDGTVEEGKVWKNLPPTNGCCSIV